MSIVLASGMPPRFAIGTSTAFRKNYPFPYTKQNFDDETAYVCTKGSEHAKEGERLVLRYDQGTWTAWDSAVVGETLTCRQPVFRCEGDITNPGWHRWTMNQAASADGDGSDANWTGELWAETKHT